MDFLTKKREKNQGQIAQYYVENNHPAIVKPEIWEAVRWEEQRRREYMELHHIKAYSSDLANNPFASKVICGECGEAFGRKKWRPRPGEYRSVWQCNARYRVKEVMGCSNRHIDESTLEEIFVKAWNTLLAYRAEQLIKYADMDVQKFDAEQMHRILECIVIFEMGKISVRYLDGTIVRF